MKAFRNISFLLLWSSFLMSCISNNKFRTGNEAFERKHYFTAVSMFENEINRSQNKSAVFEKLFKIGESYRLMNDPRSAILNYKKALEIADDELAYFRLAGEYKKIEEHNLALESLENSKRVFGNTQSLIRELAICRQSIDLKAREDKNILLQKTDFNTAFSDFICDIDDDIIYISSDRSNKSDKIYGWTGKFYYDIYISNNEKLKYAESLDGNVNTDFNESSPSVDAGKKIMYFVRCGERSQEINNCYIHFAKKENGKWIDGGKLPFQKEGYNYVSPRLSSDKQKLFFASDVRGGMGGYDIYYSKLADGAWLEPVRLPNSVNTPGNENFITTWKDDIYFSSDFFSGLGGLDIFKTGIDVSGQFLPPENLRPPFNSGGDDFNLIKTSDTTGFFSSSRVGGYGFDDIYSFIKMPVKDTIGAIKDTLQNSVAEEKKLYLAIKVVENVYSVADDPNSRILGKKPVPDAVIKFGDMNFTSDANGILIRQIPFDTSINISVGKNTYLSTNQIVEAENESIYKDKVNTINVRLVLEKIYLDKEIVIRNIYYDFDKWDLRPESESTLNILFNVLKNNSQFFVVIGSHTDCRGDEEYNIDLSQKRAQSVVDYLGNKGISSVRIKAKGYGKNKLLENCDCDKCTEDQHQLNRRTTFELKSGF
ncbi:MAG: OmpA family protein [Deltaproteobacteria bacterium]